MINKTLFILWLGLLFPATGWTMDNIRYGVEAEYPPFASKNPQGELTGFDIELGAAICQVAHLRCLWQETDFDRLIPELNAKKFDVINSSMNITPARRQRIDFTHPIYRIPSQLIAREGLIPVFTDEALRGKHIGVLQGSIQAKYAEVHWQPKGVTITTYQDQNMVYSDMLLGRLDGTLVMAAAGQAGFLDQPEGKGFVFVGEPAEDATILGSGIGLGVRKGDIVLRARLNQAIDQLKADGTVQRLANKYLSGIDVAVK